MVFPSTHVNAFRIQYVLSGFKPYIHTCLFTVFSGLDCDAKRNKEYLWLIMEDWPFLFLSL